jgi:hypothetical protein
MDVAHKVPRVYVVPDGVDDADAHGPRRAHVSLGRESSGQVKSEPVRVVMECRPCSLCLPLHVAVVKRPELRG